MANKFSDKIVQQAQAGDIKSVMDLISDFVEEESTTYSKVQNLIKQLRRKNVKNFGKIKDTLLEESKFLKDEAPLTVGGVLKRRIANSPGARRLKEMHDTGTVLTRGTIAEKMAMALGVSDKEDIADNIRKRALQKKRAKRDQETFKKMSNVEKFRHLQGKRDDLDEEDSSDEIDNELDKLYLQIKKDNEITKKHIDDLESEINKATGNKKKELELQLQKVIEDLESSEALFGEPEDSPLLKKAKAKRKHKLSVNTRRAASTMSDFEMDEEGNLVLGTGHTKKKGGAGESLGDVRVTTRQTAVLFNRRPLGVSLVNSAGKLAENKAAEAIYEQTEYEKKKSKLDARKHAKERIDDQRFWEQQLDEVKEDEGGGEGGLLAMLAALLAFLSKTFFGGLKFLSKGVWDLAKLLGKFTFSGIKFLTKGLWDLTKGVGKLTTKLPVVGKYFAQVGRFLKGTPGRDIKTGRFTKSRNVFQRAAGGIKNSKMSKWLGFGKKAGGLAKAAGGLGEAGSIAGGAETALAGGAEAAAVGGEVAGTAAVGGEAAGGIVALASNPIGWIVAAVLGAAVAAFLAWKYVIPKKWKTKIMGAVKDVGKAAVSVWHGMEKLAKPIGEAFKGLFEVYKRIAVDIIGAVSLIWKATKPIRDFFEKLLIRDIQGAWHAIQTIGSWFGKAIQGFKKGLTAIKNVLMPIFEFIGHAADVVKHALGKAWNWLEDHVPGLKKATTAVKTVASAVKQGTETAIKTAVKTVTHAEHELHAAGEQTIQSVIAPASKPTTVQTRPPVQIPVTKISSYRAGRDKARKDYEAGRERAEKDYETGRNKARKDYEAGKSAALATRPSHLLSSRTPIPRGVVGIQANQVTVQAASTKYNPVIHVHAPEAKPAPVTRNVPMPNMNIPTLDNTPAIVDDNGLLFLNLSAY